MIRIDRASGFIPASPWKPGPLLGSPVVRRLAPPKPSRVMAQAIVMTPEQVDAKDRLIEAQQQLESLEANRANLILAMGLANVQKALEEARASVALYQEALAQGGLWQ